MIKNHGFIYEPRKREDYVFGALKGNPLKQDGQWKDLVPKKEIQVRNGVETMSCVSFATLNIIETLLKYRYEREENYSDRFTAVMSETTRAGNTPNNVAQSIRHDGVIPETSFPFGGKTFEEYHSGVTTRHRIEGQKFLNEWSVGHEWVDTNKRSLMSALKYSPLGVSVLAWKQRNGLYYKEKGESDNHWTVLCGYKKGEYWIVYDSYENVFKHLEWDYPFGMAKRYSLNPYTGDNWFIRLLKKVLELFI